MGCKMIHDKTKGITSHMNVLIAHREQIVTALNVSFVSAVGIESLVLSLSLQLSAKLRFAKSIHFA